MATPCQELYVSPTTSRNHDPATARLKLRNSCQGCAVSKLKCSQEKPTCSRCAKRRISCQYLAAKQGGRKPNRQANGNHSHTRRSSDPNLFTKSLNNDPSAHLLLPLDWFDPALTSNAGIDRLPSPGPLHHSPSRAGFLETPINVMQDLFSSDKIDTIRSSTVSTTATTQTYFGDYFSTTPPSFSGQVPTLDSVGAAKILHTGVDDGGGSLQQSHFDAMPSYRDSVSELFSVSTPSPVLATEAISDSSIEIPQNCKGSGKTESLDHSCLIRALQLMEAISTPSCHLGSPGIASIRAILARNKDTLTAVGAMVKCACSEDGYLLAIVSLIIFKVLDWYTAVAGHSPSLQQDTVSQEEPPTSRSSSTVSPCTISSDYGRPGSEYCFKGTDSARMAAQLVLSELYLVRRLVEQLSTKLREHGRTGEKKNDDTTAAALERVSEASYSDSDLPSPLSVATYASLGIALAERLRSLSLSTIDQLRKI
ncbi:hypothetical protein ED733_001742 [Metarhizium rileyi]|uniref:Zn(2)-C6 fungal-type domain-containing protein n=1 Tax=Metarhizium rileyi (strain RCEF 4871) TaxID=1649241 RepID=A0A5C6FZZ7_METRR|nr:hypothetical protein ED733_001742 [Metarhizium rileyi]